jgi:hypothetical protein
MGTKLNEIYAARTGVAVVTSNTNVIEPTRALLIGGAGNLAVKFADDPATTVTLKGFAAGQVVPFSVIQVLTATTATDIVALY